MASVSHSSAGFGHQVHQTPQLLLSSAALSAVYVLRKPSWPQLRMLGVATGTAFGSLALGNALTLKSHFDFVRSLNNTAGFAGAIDRIQKQAGLPQPNGPIIQRRYEIGEGLHGNTEEQQGHFPSFSIYPSFQLTFKYPEFTQTLPMAESPPPPPPQQQQEQSQSQGSAQDRHPSSKWDQIRAANAAASTSSTWDALRQKHEKSQAQKPGNDSPSQSTNPPADDRATEQARFNALLERERNLSSQHRREE